MSTLCSNNLPDATNDTQFKGLSKHQTAKISRQVVLNSDGEALRDFRKLLVFRSMEDMEGDMKCVSDPNLIILIETRPPKRLDCTVQFAFEPENFWETQSPFGASTVEEKWRQSQT